MEVIRIIGRSSRLSLLQMEIVKQKIKAAYPETEVQIIARSSRGDALQDVALHTVEGSDFFTRDIFDALERNEADIAVHSLKDLSSEHFLGTNQFAIVDRDDTRDVVILNQSPEFIEKIRNGGTVVIGTCSPRREEMATGFLQKALPRLNREFKIATKEIRGNVDTRLRKLDNGEYDGIILATAGLNRLLNSREDALVLRELLSGKKLLLLPLIECVPAPCQGAIVAETHSSNKRAVEILKEINDIGVADACIQEKKMAMQYGTGCLQKFGVTTIRYGNTQVLYAAGRDSKGWLFTKWKGLPDLAIQDKEIFSATDFMGNFFNYEYSADVPVIEEPVVYVANYKAVEKEELIEQLKKKRVWASGTRTWFELAKKGIWVEGCADAFGLEFLQAVWQMPLLGVSQKDIAIVTGNEAAGIWQSKGWKTYSTYSAIEKHSPEVGQKIRQAAIIFWASYRQFLQYKNVIRQDVIHVCSYGETAQQFKQAGIRPVIFPNIKAFQQWRQTSTRSHSVA